MTCRRAGVPCACSVVRAYRGQAAGGAVPQRPLHCDKRHRVGGLPRRIVLEVKVCHLVQTCTIQPDDAPALACRETRAAECGRPRQHAWAPLAIGQHKHCRVGAVRPRAVAHMGQLHSHEQADNVVHLHHGGGQVASRWGLQQGRRALRQQLPPLARGRTVQGVRVEHKACRAVPQANQHQRALHRHQVTAEHAGRKGLKCAGRAAGCHVSLEHGQHARGKGVELDDVVGPICIH